MSSFNGNSMKYKWANDRVYNIYAKLMKILCTWKGIINVISTFFILFLDTAID